MSTAILMPIAGIGSRMTKKIPKCLIKIGRSTIISRQLKMLRRRFPDASRVFVVGYRANEVVKTAKLDRSEVVYNKAYRTSNVAHSLRLGLQRITADRVIIVYGDLVFSHSASKIPLEGSWLLLDTTNKVTSNRKGEVGVNVADGKVASLNYGIWPKWGQILVLEGKELALFRQAAANPTRRRSFGFELINDVIEAGGSIGVVEQRGLKLVEVDCVQDISRASAMITKKKKAAEPPENTAEINS